MGRGEAMTSCPLPWQSPPNRTTGAAIRGVANETLSGCGGAGRHTYPPTRGEAPHPGPAREALPSRNFAVWTGEVGCAHR